MRIGVQNQALITATILQLVFLLRCQDTNIRKKLDGKFVESI